MYGDGDSIIGRKFCSLEQGHLDQSNMVCITYLVIQLYNKLIWWKFYYIIYTV